MYQIIRSLLFLLKPEQAHHTTMSLLRLVLAIPGMKTFFRKRFAPKHATPVTVAGITFPNHIGLAAGFDKNAAYLHELAVLGFGFIEIGTLTPRPQAGNPKPRLFRLKRDLALINRMGFNNDGVEVAIERLKKRPDHLIVGGNIGKNKDTPNEQAVDDYMYCFKALFPYVDYFVVNVSSPNTPDLRALQDKEPLTKLLGTLQDENLRQNQPKPIFLKIAPDLNESQLDDIADIVRSTAIAGLIATNTTIHRDLLTTDRNVVKELGAGGLSGKPVAEMSTHVIRYLRKRLPETPIIGVGGIFTTEDARQKIEAGANLLQVYTGFVYQGPKIVKTLLETHRQ